MGGSIGLQMAQQHSPYMLQWTSNENDGGTTNTTVLTLPQASKKGSTIVVPFTHKTSGGQTLVSVIDSAAQTYVSGMTPVVEEGYTTELYYFQNTVAGVTSITITCTGNPPTLAFAAEEGAIVTSGSIFDATAVPKSSFNLTPSTTFTTGNMVTSTTPQLVVYGYAFTGYGNYFSTLSGNWTVVGIQQNIPDGDSSILGRMVVNAVGAYAFTGAIASQNVDGEMVFALRPSR
jgi:hypothetical protein